ncbi:hypothetical protein EV13_0721 [Prochlorococcus sp. MIT 0702]|uniref:hypothetical protein n=1 Tax=Prochlorococcus sp. MIT 0702 TaxID=1499503 RepID=UPI0005339BA7|nr:hypothetical protein EV12_0321 [Prochlorococcus sp. MIT 0701]KGG29917.1 hypothetical protein EV13_0721 [Prochlorococcus sp. MIT 0702]KGG34125.1 hypothetical protein EV14_1472 [Prochlorococcus sp. MIT 0703]
MSIQSQQGKTFASTSTGFKQPQLMHEASLQDGNLLSWAGRVPVGFRQGATLQQQGQSSSSMS